MQLDYMENMSLQPVLNNVSFLYNKKVDRIE